MPQQTDNNGIFIEGMTDPTELRRFLQIKFLQEEIQSAYDILLKGVRAQSRENSEPPLRALWDFLDQSFSKKSEHLKCGQGCAFCCHTGVTATQLEWDGILTAAQKKGIDLNAVMARSSKSIDRIRQAMRLEKKLKQTDWHQLVMNQPCPFLDDQRSCIVYEDRPLDCRMVVAFRGECESKNLEHAQRGVWLEEAVAPTVIARFQHERTPKIKRRKFDGTQPVKLLQAWLIAWQDKKSKKRKN
tara:strand:- start:376 stop:1104 length:729 start_codon:yes stop_codon:yes gene_type:complete